MTVGSVRLGSSRRGVRVRFGSDSLGKFCSIVLSHLWLLFSKH